MTWVVIQQFQADSQDIINVAGTGSQLKTSAEGASGTFTFVSGIVFYYCFTVSFIIYGYLVKPFPNGCFTSEPVQLY